MGGNRRHPRKGYKFMASPEHIAHMLHHHEDGMEQVIRQDKG